MGVSAVRFHHIGLDLVDLYLCVRTRQRRRLDDTLRGCFGLAFWFFSVPCVTCYVLEVRGRGSGIVVFWVKCWCRTVMSISIDDDWALC